MKKMFLLLMILLLSFTAHAHAAFVSGSTGADGLFNPTANTEVTLPADGILNYTTVNIPSGVTVTFRKNAANTPVYILATGDVTIAGTIVITGGNATSSMPGWAGPGAFTGGYGGGAGLPGGNGLGPGGGGAGPYAGRSGGGGGFVSTGGTRSTTDGAGGSAYGNARLFPFIGGSGGGGCPGSTSGVLPGGGGGGGAIAIASSGNITILGSILADGGSTPYYINYCGAPSECPCSGGGSGGAIKLIANAIYGSGTIKALGGNQRSGSWIINIQGGNGRIRVEAYTNSFNGISDPYYTFGQPGSVFPANEPILRITSIAGVNVPSNPTGSYSQPDIMLPSTTTNPVAVNISAAYIPVGTSVTVSMIPQYGSATNVNTTLSGVLESSTASANVSLSTQYSNVITAQATYTLQTAMYYEGEKIEKVRVAAVTGKESEAIYITESGREIKAEELIIAGLVK